MRYLPHTEADRQEMLAAIGVETIDDLYKDVPPSARTDRPLDGLPMHQGELQVERFMAGLAGKNTAAGSVPSFLGAGAYRHHIPATVDYLIQRGEFLTAYTPYQPEVSQGTLHYLYEFQTQVALLTGMDVANASMYDGSTACAEAVMMANRVTKRGKAILSGGLHPHYRSTTRNLVHFTGHELVECPADPDGTEDLASLIDDQTSCVVVQTPSAFGHPKDLRDLAEACHAKGALLVVAVAEVVSLGMLESPGAMGADIVIGEGQSLGNPLNFGGPYVGLFATRDKLVRQMPGRLTGQATDAEGRRGFVLTLSTREQHIRRDKATSNICTNSGLCALAFTIHLSLLGEAGMTRLAELNHATACKLADALDAVDGAEVINDGFFNEFTVRLAKPAVAVVDALAERGVLAGVPASRLWGEGVGVDDLLLVAATETNTDEDIAAYAAALQEVLR